MNKLSALALALSLLSGSCSVYASSTITLPVPSDNKILPNAEMELSLNSLTSEVPFIITCHLGSTSPAPLEMTFTPHLAPNGGFGVAKLNGKALLQNVGTLTSGQNTYTFLASVSLNKKDAKNVIVLKNLDNRFAAIVKTCQAQPATNVTTAAAKVAGGYFYLTNRLPYFLDVNIGNYFPTPYCIPPYSRQFIETSTCNQNIDVVGTHY